MQNGAPPESAWTLGDPDLDALIGPRGLEIGAVHEIKPAAGQDWSAATAAARGFALALGGRRLATGPRGLGQAPVLWCASRSQAAEHGAPYGPGLAAYGLDPARLIVVEPARTADALWAIEEGLEGGSVALVLGHVDDVGLTPARRLALAAARGGTPCLLLTHPRSAATAATATRWRVAPASSAPHELDAEAPGAARLGVGLERCRGRPAQSSDMVLLEWCHEASRLRLVAGLADRTAGARLPAGGPPVAVA